ncbi:SDR family NAD(P)-dependent oxidoreductase [Zunongwangia sp. HGR-M22]|uniref:SDR family NAD(P)-dependent oxidoreductase n=1 Tax=Zunongwangia sp. HGR-M22 TaxID=3015168 RepID=UPI0022DE3054|nr:SDR family oxidoreductase [Zunongwangia sp. HGR-M22]WBL24704.1 SDR family NAD(P)-dependent oxidoreductase [Zunongwangia sp. HGR-M22]
MKSSFDLKRKKVVITGGSSGIGEAISKKLVAHGADVVILDINIDKANQLKADTSKFEGSLNLVACDISNYKETEIAFAAIEKEHNIDILINNAGVAHVGNIENTSEEDLDKIYNINVKGVFNCSKAVIAGMKSQKSGLILNMASIASVVGIEDRFAYSMSKGAVLTMTYSLAKDYLKYNIRCNAISPARVHTPFVDAFIKKNYPNEIDKKFEELSKTQPIGRMGAPEEVAALALYLCSNEASFITGTNFPIDGGFIKLNG